MLLDGLASHRAGEVANAGLHGLGDGIPGKGDVGFNADLVDIQKEELVLAG